MNYRIVSLRTVGLVGWLWTKHHILLGPMCYLPVELSPCSKGSQGEGEAAVIAHQPVSQGIEPWTTESVDREESPEPPAPQAVGTSLTLSNRQQRNIYSRRRLVNAKGHRLVADCQHQGRNSSLTSVSVQFILFE